MFVYLSIAASCFILCTHCFILLFIANCQWLSTLYTNNDIIIIIIIIIINLLIYIFIYLTARWRSQRLADLQNWHLAELDEIMILRKRVTSRWATPLDRFLRHTLDTTLSDVPSSACPYDAPSSGSAWETDSGAFQRSRKHCKQPEKKPNLTMMKCSHVKTNSIRSTD